ncbi:hypothetical protein GCM10017667_65190 [Streptomyces filamentosus]|uniref:Uncharacterized protein n=1 Tax=Streptomyces filamentosus TaxID=67294 RepID=A0A919BX74_STRFL|nr:hypothetical protein GCM10017667_65190 [Streptomyces filamentosus]
MLAPGHCDGTAGCAALARHPRSSHVRGPDPAPVRSADARVHAPEGGVSGAGGPSGADQPQLPDGLVQLMSWGRLAPHSS